MSGKKKHVSWKHRANEAYCKFNLAIPVRQTLLATSKSSREFSVDTRSHVNVQVFSCRHLWFVVVLFTYEYGESVCIVWEVSDIYLRSPARITLLYACLPKCCPLICLTLTVLSIVLFLLSLFALPLHSPHTHISPMPSLLHPYLGWFRRFQPDVGGDSGVHGSHAWAGPRSFPCVGSWPNRPGLHWPAYHCL